ncbi:MAG: hypothetical protein LBH31_08675, partial [Burkholderiaceae bacterium]|nr:hypothetical protein [Burkholderiaceae bacterium]
RDARLASPATRSPGANKENFIIELQLDPGRYGLVQSTAGAAPDAISVAAPATAASAPVRSAS